MYASYMVVQNGHNSHIQSLLAVAISTWSLLYYISDLQVWPALCVAGTSPF